MPLTETELKQIHVESETLYPYPVDKSDIQNLRLQEMKRRVFFAAVTAERKRAKVLLDALRKAFSQYVKTEGCSCCQDVVPHSIAAAEIGELLGFEKYKDGSGYNFYELPIK